MTKTLVAALAGTLAAGAMLAAAPLIAKPAAKARPGAVMAKWDAVISRTAEGNFLIGNPAAKVRLVEFISYTCGHCAHYALDSKVPLFTGPVRQGKVAVEMRPFFRNGIDVAATLLAQCGPAEKFIGNHHAILSSQATWLKEPSRPDARQRWSTPEFGPKVKYMAEDMGLYALMLERGYTAAQLDTCLADEALGDRLAKQTADATDRLGVQGTPSFLINGKLQTVHEWNLLAPLLNTAAR